MKVLSARGAECRPIPWAAALSRAAPPPKVFSLHPPPETFLHLGPSKYLPQPPGRSSDHSKAPPGPRGLLRARTRSPTPARSPFADGGHPARRLEACTPPTGWDKTTAAQSPRSQVRTPAHLLFGRLRRPLPPRTLSPRTLSLWGGGVACPQASLDLTASVLRGPVANPTEKNQGGAQVGYFRLGGPLISLELYRHHQGLHRKWRRHRPESRSRSGQAGLSVGKGRASQDPGWRPAPPTGLR